MLPLCDCIVGEVVSGFHGPFVRATHGSEDSAKALEPLGPSGNSSLPAATSISVTADASFRGADLPRDRETSLLVFENALPIVLLPHIPLEGCHVPPFPKVVWPMFED